MTYTSTMQCFMFLPHSDVFFHESLGLMFLPHFELLYLKSARIASTTSFVLSLRWHAKVSNSRCYKLGLLVSQCCNNYVCNDYFVSGDSIDASTGITLRFNVYWNGYSFEHTGNAGM